MSGTIHHTGGAYHNLDEALEENFISIFENNPVVNDGELEAVISLSYVQQGKVYSLWGAWSPNRSGRIEVEVPFLEKYLGDPCYSIAISMHGGIPNMGVYSIEPGKFVIQESLPGTSYNFQIVLVLL